MVAKAGYQTGASGLIRGAQRRVTMQGFKSPASAQRFVAIHAAVYNVFNVQRHLIRRATLHSFRAEAHQAWNDATVAA